MRARIDVSEIEAQTKIRAKYLRALENEEWDLLPGPTFVKSFLRTYAQALGLDGRALVEEYKLHYEHPGEGMEPIQQPAVSSPRRIRPRGGGAPYRRGPIRDRGHTAQRAGSGAPPRQGPSRAYMATVGAVGLVIVLLVYALLSGGGGNQSPLDERPDREHPARSGEKEPLRTQKRCRDKHGDTGLAEGGALGGSVRVPDRRRAQANPGPDPDSGIDAPHVSRAALRSDAGQRRGEAGGERRTAHGAGVLAGDRVRDHEGGDAPAGGERTADVQVNR